MTIKVLGFGAPITSVPVGTYFSAFAHGWKGVCLAVEAGAEAEPLCLVLDYEGDMGDQFPTPRMLNISVLGFNLAAVPREQLVIRPRAEKDARPFLAKVESSAAHGALVLLPNGDPVIVVRKAGQGLWSLSTGKKVVSLEGGIIYPEWEIAIVEPALSHSTLVRFPEEEG
ncbi:hypothetical protein [Phenylobacterium koreense]|uniref:Uncharacterized protein n=1 Tax=Phenylobacterium koreense TaxID=266125 RepID=A0ABV2EM64_9CAUL